MKIVEQKSKSKVKRSFKTNIEDNRNLKLKIYIASIQYVLKQQKNLLLDI